MLPKSLVQFFLTLVEILKGEMFARQKNKFLQEKTKENQENPRRENISPTLDSVFQEENASPPGHWLQKNASAPPPHWLEKVRSIPPESWEGNGKAVTDDPLCNLHDKSIPMKGNTFRDGASWPNPGGAENFLKQEDFSPSIDNKLEENRQGVPFVEGLNERNSPKGDKGYLRSYRSIGPGNSAGSLPKHEGEHFERKKSLESIKTSSSWNIEPQEISEDNFHTKQSFHTGGENFNDGGNAEALHPSRNGIPCFPENSPITHSERIKEISPNNRSADESKNQWSASSSEWFGRQRTKSGFYQIEDDGGESFAKHSWPGLLLDSADMVGESVILLQREFNHLKDLEREQGGRFWKE